MARQRERSSKSRQVLLKWAQQQLAAAGRDAPRRMAEWILIEVLEINRGQLYARSGRIVAPDAEHRFREMVDRCVEGEPLQHVLGYTSFRGLRIEVSSAVMIPRPETEEVVGTALDVVSAVKTPRVLDVGTGSGCIALAIKHERPDAQVTAWDVNAEALAVARHNADRLGLDVHFAEVDLFSEEERGRLAEPVDLLISNPPYIPNEEAETLPAVVREYDPPEALFSGDDPLRFYRELASRAEDLCTPGAAIVLETHADYAAEAADVLRDAGLDNVCVDTDLSDRPRILTACYLGADGRA